MDTYPDESLMQYGDEQSEQMKKTVYLVTDDENNRPCKHPFTKKKKAKKAVKKLRKLSENKLFLIKKIKVK